MKLITNMVLSFVLSALLLNFCSDSDISYLPDNWISTLSSKKGDNNKLVTHPSKISEEPAKPAAKILEKKIIYDRFGTPKVEVLVEIGNRDISNLQLDYKFYNAEGVLVESSYTSAPSLDANGKSRLSFFVPIDRIRTKKYSYTVRIAEEGISF